MQLLPTAFAVAIVISACSDSGPRFDSRAISVETTVPNPSSTTIDLQNDTPVTELEEGQTGEGHGDEEETAGSTDQGVDLIGADSALEDTDVAITTEPDAASVSQADTSSRANIYLYSPIRSTLLVGDSLYFDTVKFDRETPLQYTNRLADFAFEQLVSRHEAFRNTVFENASAPGVSIDRRPDSLDKTVRDVLDEKVFGLPPDQRPDLVVYTTSRIDINRDDLPFDQLVPALVETISRDVSDLTEAGIQVVIVPGLPVHDGLYTASAEKPGNRPLNGRVDILNAAIVAADLPILPIGFVGLDIDGVPGPDDTYYRDYSTPEFAVHGITTDGVHLAESGQRAAASDIADGFDSIVFEDGSASPSSLPE